METKFTNSERTGRNGPYYKPVCECKHNRPERPSTISSFAYANTTLQRPTKLYQEKIRQEGMSHLQPELVNCSHNGVFQRLPNKKAFTLIEMVVAMTIFMIFVSMIVGTYLYIARAQRNLAEDRKFYSGARDVIEEISKEIKLNKIYYSCYEGSISGVSECVSNDLSIGLPTSTLALVNREKDNLIVYSFDEGVFVREYMVDENTLEWVAADGYEEGALRISAEGIDMSNLNFRIFPYADPDENYDEERYQFMPYVTIYLTVLDGNGFPYSLETSVTTRIYE